MPFNPPVLSGISAKSTILLALGLVALSLLLFAALGQTSAVSAAPSSQSSCTGPSATDKVDKSGLMIEGPTAYWKKHANACAYRVILKSKDTKARLDAINTTATSYTIPSDKVTAGSKYILMIKMLDSSGKVAGKSISMSFIYHSAAPTCFVSPNTVTYDEVISGQTVTWKHDQACAYRVILKSKSDGTRIDMVNTTVASYTIPSDKVTAGSQYSITFKLLDHNHKVKGRPISIDFTYQP